MNTLTQIENSPPTAQLQRKLTWLALLVAAAILVAFRLHAFDLPLEADECNYAYIGSRLLGGDRLYVDVWDHQPFGVFVLFAGVMKIFGDTPDVFRWMATTFSLASLLLIFAILKRIANHSTAVTGAIIFAMASSDPGTAGEGCNREIYMATLVLASWYLALRSNAKPGWALLLSGSALGVASAIKTIVAVQWVFLAGWIAVVAWQTTKPPRRGKMLACSLAMFSIGPLLLWVGSLVYFSTTNRLDEFVDAVFLFNLSYSGSGEGFAMRFLRFFAPEKHIAIFESALPLWLAGIPATIWLTVDALRRRNKETFAILLLLITTYVAVCLPARFWPHYYYLLIPTLAIAVPLAAAGLSTGLRRTLEPQSGSPNLVTIAILAAIPLILAWTQYDTYLRQPPFGITVDRYNSRDFWGRAQGLNVGKVTDPDDEIFVFGNDPEIYYYAKRKCASRYTMITGLAEGLDSAVRRRTTLLEELRAKPPRLIVVLFDEKPFDKWPEFLREFYGEPVGWDFHDKHRKPIMFVLARKNAPIKTIDWDWDRSIVGGWMLGDQPPDTNR